MGDKSENIYLYQDMAHVFNQNFQTWSYYIITSDMDFEKHFSRRANKKESYIMVAYCVIIISFMGQGRQNNKIRTLSLIGFVFCFKCDFAYLINTSNKRVLVLVHKEYCNGNSNTVCRLVVVYLPLFCHELCNTHHHKFRNTSLLGTDR